MVEDCYHIRVENIFEQLDKLLSLMIKELFKKEIYEWMTKYTYNVWMLNVVLFYNFIIYIYIFFLNVVIMIVYAFFFKKINEI